MNGCQTTLLTCQDEVKGKGPGMIAQQVFHMENRSGAKVSQKHHLLKCKVDVKTLEAWETEKNSLVWRTKQNRNSILLMKIVWGTKFWKVPVYKMQEQIKECISVIRLKELQQQKRTAHRPTENKPSLDSQVALQGRKKWPQYPIHGSCLDLAKLHRSGLRTAQPTLVGSSNLLETGNHHQYVPD